MRKITEQAWNLVYNRKKSQTWSLPCSGASPPDFLDFLPSLLSFLLLLRLPASALFSSSFSPSCFASDLLSFCSAWGSLFVAVSCFLGLQQAVLSEILGECYGWRKALLRRHAHLVRSSTYANSAVFAFNSQWDDSKTLGKSKSRRSDKAVPTFKTEFVSNLFNFHNLPQDFWFAWVLESEVL